MRRVPGDTTRSNMRDSRHRWLAILVLTTTSCVAACEAAEDPDGKTVQEIDVLRYVDPFIGTGGDHGQLHPGAAVPFGMIMLGPETTGKSHSGYDYNAHALLGFSHNRSSGVGCRGSGGNVLVRADYDAPARNEVVLHKETESAAPGYYSTEYGNDRIRAEMTATRATGWQRYRFPRSGTVYLTVDAGYAHHRLYDASISTRTDATLEGAVTGATVCDEGKYTVYFSLGVDRPPVVVTTLDDGRVALEYRVDQGDEIVVTTTLSSVDEDTASRLRAAESAELDFARVRAQAEAHWRGKLSKIAITGDEEDRTLFYTSLYRVYHSPYLLAQAGERFRGSSGRTQVASDGDHYFGWSVWDTFRTKHPLLTIVESDVARDIGRSLAAMYFDSKPLWATNTEPYPTVRTEHSGIVLLDLWRKNLADFDAEALLPHLAAESDRMPRNSPDQVLEAAYDDWAVGTFARLLGSNSMADEYIARAAEYRPMWNRKFRDMGDTADIMHGDGLYEGTLWQYRWFVPFDTDWLIRQLDGPDGFARELAYFFDNELFNIGNQPDIQAPFMFTLSGAPWRTQRVVRDLLRAEGAHWYGTHEKKAEPFVGRVFRAQPAAFIPEMDDDAGTMSAWYVLASLGLYPFAPGVPVYSLHTPLYESVRIDLDNGRVFEIRTPDSDQPFIASARLNGAPLDRPWILHAELMQGGVLEFVTSPEPDMEWGSQTPCRTTLDSPPQTPCGGGTDDER